MKKTVVLFLIFLLFLTIYGFAFAQDEKIDYDAKIKALEKKLEELQKELEELRREQKEKKEESQVQEEPLPFCGQVISSTNPDISLIGNLIWKINHNRDIDKGNPFELSDIELAIQHNIDPFSRADVFLHYHDEHIHACEAYATLFKTPFDFLQTKVGKFKANFGKINTIHGHEQPWIDKPLMITNFFGAEGLSGTGISTKAVFPLGNVYSELILEGFNDENSRSFSGGASGKPLYNARFKAYADLSDTTNIELGISHLEGYNDAGCNNMTKISGLDLTYRWRPALKAKYNSLLLRGEALFSKRENPNGEILERKGLYGFGQYQMNRNWYIGARYDYSEFPGLLNDIYEKAWSGILTYYPSEFMAYRLQYKDLYRSYASRLHELWFQVIFNIGPHGAHEF